MKKIAVLSRKKATLYEFKGGCDGETSEGAWAMDRTGKLYGTTFKGSENCPTGADLGSGYRTVYEIVRK